MNMEGLVTFANMDRAIIARHLDAMVRNNEVEVLRPCMPVEAGDPTEPCVRKHFRLLRETDGDYEWERETVVRLPQGRLFDVGVQERRAETRARTAWWRANKERSEVLTLKYT